MSKNSQTRRRIKEARRNARMKQTQARLAAEARKAKSTTDMKGKNMLPEKSSEQANATVRLHRMLNRLAETTVGDEFINSTASALLKQMESGYRLAFPLFMEHGHILSCVALLALANDPRLKAIRELRASPEASHVLVFLAFASESEWLTQATKMAKLFPEQPDKPELVSGVK